VVAYSNEEGGRGTAPMVGSRAIAGRAIDLQAVDDHRVALSDRLTAAGGRPDDLRTAAWHACDVEAVIELHIEQGPVLEQTGRQIGVVDVISGRANVEIEVTGLARHAGTTPMGHRADALVAGAQLILAIQALANSGWVRVATVGRLEVAPGMRNVIPSQATLSLDVRDGDANRLAHGLDRLDRLAEEVAITSGCQVVVKRGESVAPVATDRTLRGWVSEAARDLGLSLMTMPSGAGHDTQLLASLAPIALCFVPSMKGISHSPDENSHPADLVAGANVLLASLLLADARLST
jgi:hydantoinase/carbamoylase family amidase